MINRTPASAIEFEIPEKAWTGVLPDLGGLRSFGWIAYVHSKLNPRAKKGVFLGYPAGVKGYRVWLIDDRKVVISKDVVFNEEVMYKSSTEEGPSEDRSTAEPEVAVINAPTVTTEESNVDQGGVVERENTTQENSFPEQEQGSESETDSEEDYMPPSLADYQLARDRERRITRPPKRYDELGDLGFAYNLIEDGGVLEPQSYAEAMSSSESELWRESIDEEMISLRKNHA